MAFVHWDSIRLLAVQQRVEGFAPGPAGWVPPVDLYEAPDRYVITAEVPGLRREDVEIHVGERRLTISGTRRERVASCERFHRLERGHGSFSRTFDLPVPFDPSRIAADLRDGVLTIVCPKDGSEVRHIHIA